MIDKKAINIFLTKYYLMGMFGAMYFIGSFIMIIVNESISDAFKITILLSMFSITKIVFEIPSGAFADRFGRKNTLLLADLLGALAFVFFLLRRNYFDFIMSYFLMGLWSTLRSGAFEALIYDNMKKLNIAKDYAKYNSRFSAVMQVSFALSSLFAAYLVLFGYNVVIIATILFSFIVSSLVLLTIKDTNQHDKNIKKLNNDYWKVLRKGFKYSFKHTTILKFISFVVLIDSFEFIIDNYYELILFHITNNLSLVPILIAAGSGCSALGQFFITKHFQKKRTIVILSILGFGVTSLLIGFIFYSFYITFISAVIFWNSLSISYSILNAKKQNLIPSKIRATVNSVEGFLFGILGVIYLLFFGSIVKASSYQIGFTLLSVIALLTVLVFLFILGKDKHLIKKERRLK